MISITPLYNPQTHRYKGVYPWKNYYRALAQSPESKQVFLGYHQDKEVAARAVAEYYHKVYGPNWPQAIKDRQRRNWRIRRVARFPYMASLHRGPKVLVYIAEVKTAKGWYKIMLADLSEAMSVVSPVWDEKWNGQCGGWRTSAAALVAIRMYQATSTAARPSQASGG